MGNQPSLSAPLEAQTSFQSFDEYESFLRTTYPGQRVFFRVQGPDGIFVYRVHQHPGGGLTAERFEEVDGPGKEVLRKVADFNTVSFRYLCRILLSPHYRLLDLQPE